MNNKRVGRGLSMRVLMAAFAMAVAIVIAISLAAPGVSRAQEPAPVPMDVVIGEAIGQAGDTVGLDIVIDSHGQAIRGFGIDLEFDGKSLPLASGSAGPDALPEGFALFTNLAGPGDLRFIALSFGEGTPLSGAFLHAEFTIPQDATPGKVLVSTSLVEIVTESGEPLPAEVTPGRVLVVGCGDVSLDGAVDIIDVITLLQILVGLVEPSALQVVMGDVTREGRLGIRDAILILQSLVRLAPLTGCGPR